MVIDFFSPDPAYYPDIKKFPFPDSLKFRSLESYFTNQDKTPIINDSTIVFYGTYMRDDQKACCMTDTLEKYVDSIKGKKYMFAIGEYISVFQSDNNIDTNLRIRKLPEALSLWGIQLNTPYPPSKFKNKYEKFGARKVKIDPRIDEVSQQTWNDNDSILVETIQFNNSSDRVVTSLYKEMKEPEMISVIDELKTKLPGVIVLEGFQTGSNGKQSKIIRMNYRGIAISFTQNTATEYYLIITDYYETLKHIINNADTGYIFRDDVKMY